MHKFLAVLSFCALFTGTAFPAAQNDIPNENRVYSASIHTVLLYKEGFEMSAPIIRLNSTERLVLSFDDLSEDRPDYHFTIRHCDMHWNTTPDMTTTDYITGITEDDIVSAESSFNTTVVFSHYTLNFPTANMKPRISGNYLLIVYSSDPSQPDFTCRFMVVEPSTVGVEAEVTQSDRMEDRYTWQQINFKVDMAGFPLMDPKREVKVVILQNDRWDNALYVGSPKFVRGNELDYYYDENNSFPGGNDYRSFDLKSLRSQSMRVRKIDWDGTNWQVWLLDDVNRSTKNYVSDPDINGRMLIKSDDNAVKSDLESDYAWVHFTFPFSPPSPDMKLYLYGALTGHNIGTSNEMIFNPVTRKYELDLFLKQGYYNYIYVIARPGQNYLDDSLTEGDHWETENQYQVLVYLHELGGLYDRLVAVRDVNSRDRK